MPVTTRKRESPISPYDLYFLLKAKERHDSLKMSLTFNYHDNSFYGLYIMNSDGISSFCNDMKKYVDESSGNFKDGCLHSSLFGLNQYIYKNYDLNEKLLYSMAACCHKYGNVFLFKYNIDDCSVILYDVIKHNGVYKLIKCI